jgi:tagatose-1,6-bisphosphate aldolase
MTLSTIQTPSGMFTIAPFDHRGSLAKLIGVDNSTDVGRATLAELKNYFMQVFSPICSGVLVDSEYGFHSLDYKADHCGLILTLESSGYTDEKTAVPTLLQNWGVEAIKNNYAVAKLLTYYHPQEANAEQKQKLVMELYASCKREEVPFLLEPVIFPPTGKGELSQAEFHDAQLQTCQEFQPYCDILKIQYPGDALSCATITAELDIPWILLSRGMDYAGFRDALRVSLENGAKGFAAGRSVWQEIGEMQLAQGGPDMAAIHDFLQTTATERMKELIALTEAAA